MFIAKDKSGTVLISVKEPERMAAHWKPIDCQYIVMNAKYGEQVFPQLKWKDEPIEDFFRFNL